MRFPTLSVSFPSLLIAFLQEFASVFVNCLLLIFLFALAPSTIHTSFYTRLPLYSTAFQLSLIPRLFFSPTTFTFPLQAFSLSPFQRATIVRIYPSSFCPQFPSILTHFTTSSPFLSSSGI